ncbi:metal-dependent hydrolase [Halobaculum lipolyticum]|uniref:Metal-dependent hydrolase n=1 Tax=Halobaculum lipolyticum TaxID=3032001 RepID=A0ABD5WBA0_9EURY|nr:metal-dependent hydrolase [Halobaculum sp. DT31]
MDPVGHALSAYLLWTGFTRLRLGRPPTTPEAWVLALGSQLPDLVDKPLAWSLGVLPAGRSLGHSLVTAAVLLVVLRRVLPPARRRLLAPLAVGVVSHDLLDAVAPLSRGEPAYVAYLLWPLIEQPPYDPPPPLLSAFGASLLGGVSGADAAALAVVLAVWLADGAPGVPRRRDTGTE